MKTQVAVLSLGALVMTTHLGAADWASFRGPGAAGVADGQKLPTEWDVATGRNVAWKTAIPGSAHSSPVVSGGRVFVTTSVGDRPASFVFGDEGGIAPSDDTGRHTWRVLALDAADGRVLWDREVFSAEPRAKRHVKGSYANSTPAVAGDTVVAILGSQGMVALDVKDGAERWRVDLGTLNPGLFGDTTSEWGYASSPVTDGGRVYVQVDRHASSYLAAFDVASGRQLWKVNRDERPVWATPTLARSGERQDLVVVGGYHTRGYDPESGKERWRFADEAEVKTTTPFVADGLIILSGGYRGRPMFALRPGAEGDISLTGSETTGPFVAWTTEPGGPYTSTPVGYQGLLYSVRDEGIFQVHDLSNGALVHRERTETTHAASPVASDGRVFVAAEGGEVLVYRAGREPELLARNDMGEACMATPAIASGALIVRTTGHVYAIRESERNAE
jgi:outer membrane protein assembly factor BamB